MCGSLNNMATRVRHLCLKLFPSFTSNTHSLVPEITIIFAQVRLMNCLLQTDFQVLKEIKPLLCFDSIYCVIIYPVQLSV